MKNIIILLSVLFSVNSSAQVISIEQDIGNLFHEVRSQARYLTEEQRAKVALQIKAIRDILYNQSSFSSYVCVSRDNDNRGPYVMGIRIGLDVKRIAGTTVNTTEECKAMVSSMRYTASGALSCVSRDNDARGPFQIAMFNGTETIKRIESTLASDINSCRSLVNKMNIASTGDAIFCTSRDNDMRSPYVAMSLNLISGVSRRGSEVFNELNACEAFLGGSF